MASMVGVSVFIASTARYAGIGPLDRPARPSQSHRRDRGDDRSGQQKQNRQLPLDIVSIYKVQPGSDNCSGTSLANAPGPGSEEHVLQRGQLAQGGWFSAWYIRPNSRQSTVGWLVSGVGQPGQRSGGVLHEIAAGQLSYFFAVEPGLVFLELLLPTLVPADRLGLVDIAKHEMAHGQDGPTVRLQAAGSWWRD